MKKYFIYEFKKSVFLIGVLSVIYTAICLVMFLATQHEAMGIVSLSILMIIGGFTAFFLPFSIFSYKMKKRSLDLFYSLPISHTKIVTVKFLVGLTILYIPFTIAYWLSFLILAGRADVLNAAWYVPMYFASIIPMYIIYAISAFAYTRASNKRDGAWFAILWFYAITLVIEIISRFTRAPQLSVDVSVLDSVLDLGITSNYIIPSMYSPTTPLLFVGVMFQLMAGGVYVPLTDPIVVGNMCAGFALVSLLGIGSTVGIILLEKKAKAEDCEHYSDSWFGYKVLVPLYGVCLTTTSMGLDTFSFILIVLIFVILYAVSASYRRTVKIGWKQLAIIGGSIVVGIILYYICPNYGYSLGMY